MTIVSVNCVVYTFVFTIIPLPNESPALVAIRLLLPSLVHWKLHVVHAIGGHSSHGVGHSHWHLLHILLCLTLGLELVKKLLPWLWKTSCLPLEVALCRWLLPPCASVASAH